MKLRFAIGLWVFCGILSGCEQLALRFSGERCDPLWDRKIDYRKCMEDNLKTHASAEVKSNATEDGFGACSDEDLKNHTCK